MYTSARIASLIYFHEHTEHTSQTLFVATCGARCGYSGSRPDEPPRDMLGQPLLPPPAPRMPLLPLLISDGIIELLLCLQQHAETARMHPRVNSRRMGAPPGT